MIWEIQTVTGKIVYKRARDHQHFQELLTRFNHCVSFGNPPHEIHEKIQYYSEVNTSLMETKEQITEYARKIDEIKKMLNADDVVVMAIQTKKIPTDAPDGIPEDAYDCHLYSTMPSLIAKLFLAQVMNQQPNVAYKGVNDENGKIVLIEKTEKL